MQKQAPSFGRILTMVLFALSCFGLLLFLWLSFGGSIPLKPQGYRMNVNFPEATQLGLEADVRVAGVRVGKVRGKDLDEAGNRTVALIEIDQRFAPVKQDAKAILRQKTLLGETYVELTPGTKNAPNIPEGGTLANAQIVPAVELDEIFTAFDPVTRQAFRTWQQDLEESFRGQGQNLSDSLGNLPSFATDATALLKILNEERVPLERLVRNTGVVFEALTQDEAALSGLVTNSAGVFAATASQNEALAETFQIFPTFLDESKLTLARLQRFAVDTRPLIADLKPVARDLQPTLRDVRRLAPDLRRLFRDLDPLIRVSRTGLPALRDTLVGLRPVLAKTAPFLGELNPILQWLELYQYQVSDFLGNAASGLADKVPTATPGGTGHVLRQLGPNGAETLGLHRTRLASNRGNTYLEPVFGVNRRALEDQIFPNWDCNNTGGEQLATTGVPSGEPACFVQNPIPFNGANQRFPQIKGQTYPGP